MSSAETGAAGVPSRTAWGIGGIAIAVGMFAPVVLYLFVMRNALNVPVGDEWSWVLLLYAEHTGGIHLPDLWVQHNEHRILFPSLLMLLLERCGGYNVVREIAFNVVLAILTLAAFVSLMQLTIEPRRIPLFFAVISLMLFSMTQFENWIWGFQLGWFLVNLCVIVSIVALAAYPRSAVALVVAAVTATIASYSLSSGLDVWISGAFLLGFSRPVRWPRVAAWLLMAVICFAAYLDGYVKPAHHPSTSAFAGDPLGFVRYLLTYFGAPFAWERSAWGVIPAGIVVVAAFLVATVWTFRLLRAGDQTRVNAAVPWLALAIFAAVAALMTAIGRFGFGIDQAFSSRYITVSTLFWIGSLGALLALVDDFGSLRRLPSSRPVAALALIFFAGSYALANRYSFADEQFAKEQRLAAYQSVQRPENADDLSLSYIFPVPAAIRKWAPLLVSIHELPIR